MIKLDETNRLAAAMLTRIADSLPGNVEVPAIFNAEDMALIHAFRTEREAIQHKDAITEAIKLLQSHGYDLIGPVTKLQPEDVTAAPLRMGSITRREMAANATKTPKLSIADKLAGPNAFFQAMNFNLDVLPRKGQPKNPNDRIPSEFSFKAAKALCNLADMIDGTRKIDNWTAKQIRKARKVLRDHPRGPSNSRA